MRYNPAVLELTVPQVLDNDTSLRTVVFVQ